MTWEPDPSVIDVEIISVRPPATLSPTNEITIPGESRREVHAQRHRRYKAPDPTKLASNLLMKDTNILPPEFIAD